MEQDDTVHVITCAVCKQQYKSMRGCPEQAYGCCAEIIERTVHGCYGSLVADFLIFRITDEWLYPPQQGDICDECLLALIDGGKLQFSQGVLPGEDQFDLEEARAWFNKQKAAGEIDYYPERKAS